MPRFQPSTRALRGSPGPGSLDVVPFRCSWATVMDARFTHYGSTFRRHIRLRLCGLETRILPAKGRVEGLLEVLRDAAERGRDQLSLPPTAQGRDARKLGERDARRVRLRLQSAHADHAHQPVEGVRIHGSI